MVVFRRINARNAKSFFEFELFSKLGDFWMFDYSLNDPYFVLWGLVLILSLVSLSHFFLSLSLFLSLGKSIKKLVWKGHKSIRVSFWRYFFLLIQETFCLELRINCDVIQWSCCSTFSLELFLPPKGLELRRQCRCIALNSHWHLGPKARFGLAFTSNLNFSDY